MYLYHYSKVKYPKLLTKRRQGILTPEQIEDDRQGAEFREDVGLYCDHISLFFDPIPLDIIGDLFDNRHHTWVNGNKLYQYTVNNKYLETNIAYKVVESPIAIQLLDETGWKDDDVWKKKWFRKRNKLLKEAGEIGHSKVDLDRQCEIFSGHTKDFFIKLSQREDFEDYREMYAACVPHVMIYPKSGIVNYESVQQVTIGERLAIESILTKW